MLLRKIHYLGEVYELSGDTVYELIEGLSYQVPAFQPTIDGYRTLQVEGFDTIEKLKTPLGDIEDIHVFPVLAGSKGKFSQVVVGAALIALSFVPGLQGATMFGSKMLWSTYMFQVGIMMTLGGVAQMLAPQPDLAEGDGRRSNIFSGARNTVAIGTPIPILYGEFRCAGHYLSFDVNSGKSDISD